MSDWDEVRAILKEVGKRQKEKEEWGKKIDERIEKLLKDQEKTDEQIRNLHLAIDKLLEDQKKTDEQIKDTEETIKTLAKKTNEQIKKVSEQLKRTDEQLKRTDEQLKKTDEQLKKTDEQLKKTDEQLKKTDEQLKRTNEEMRRVFRRMDREFEKTRRVVERVTDGWGRFVEGIMSPSAVKEFRKRGYRIREVLHREQIFENGKVVTEVDVFIDAERRGRKVLFVGEAKTTMGRGDLSEFIKERLTQIKKYLSKYKEYDIIGFVCSVNYRRKTDEEAIKEGIYVFRATEDIAKLSVPKNFKPKIW